ncbi:hypothetical protein ACFY5D_07900 [Paeniglutamicibacter sp. NPDC012692]
MRWSGRTNAGTRAREEQLAALATEAEMAKHAANAGADIPETPKDAG